MMTEPLKIDGPEPTRDAWLALVAKALKGADFEKALMSRSYDGIPIEPLYERNKSAVAGATNTRFGPWAIAQRVDHPDPKAAAALMRSDLEGGADALVLVLSGQPTARNFGLVANSVDQLDASLEGAMLDLVQVRIDAGGRGPEAAALVMELAKMRGHKASTLAIDFGIDPHGAMARSGTAPAMAGDAVSETKRVFDQVRGAGFTGSIFLADGRPYHEAGASQAQELAAVIASGVGTVRALDRAGVPLDAARRAVSFLLVAEADVLLTLPKFRALRRLWARVEAACGLAPVSTKVHAETAWRDLSLIDSHVNLLRATTATFAAGVGGADTICVLPFTAPAGLTDGFARRMARNTQLILLEESNLGKIADPAAGAGGAEALTQQLCEKAWAIFQEIERAGGLVESLAKGSLQAMVAPVRAARLVAVAKGRDALTGTSEFPALETVAPKILDVPKIELWREKSTGSASSGKGPTFEPLPSLRLPEPFERLRARSDILSKRIGHRPRVFLANLGAPADYTARATFARNFFAAGGIEAIGDDGFTTSVDVGAALASSGARIACLCSNDVTYATLGEAAAMALITAGAEHVYLAGRGGPQTALLQAAGVGSFIFSGCDMLGVLADVHDRLDRAGTPTN